jgi:hypothetical protein
MIQRAHSFLEPYRHAPGPIDGDKPHGSYPEGRHDPHVSASGTDDFNIGNKTIDSAVNFDLRPNPADMF